MHAWSPVRMASMGRLMEVVFNADHDMDIWLCMLFPAIAFIFATQYSFRDGPNSETVINIWTDELDPLLL